MKEVPELPGTPIVRPKLIRKTISGISPTVRPIKYCRCFCTLVRSGGLLLCINAYLQSGPFKGATTYSFALSQPPGNTLSPMQTSCTSPMRLHRYGLQGVSPPDDSHGT